MFNNNLKKKFNKKTLALFCIFLMIYVAMFFIASHRNLLDQNGNSDIQDFNFPKSSAQSISPV
ncbi:MAG: hypothetical protein ACFFC9_08225, partial [Promethearchaeota archaeon]